MNYLWLKALHIIFVVAWFAGLFYIFRLFVYHVKHKDEDNMAAAYRVMEKKLLTIIMYPAMILTLVFGGLLISINPSVLTAPWFHFKMAAVLFLIGYQILATITYARFAEGDYIFSERLCRILNEIPTILLIMIVILATVKPL